MKKHFFLLCIALCTGCGGNKPSVKLTYSNGMVILSGMDVAVLNDIARDSTPARWQSLVPVYRMPHDAGLKDEQPPQAGTYKIEDKVLLFKPDTPFISGQTYFARYYYYSRGGSLWDLMRHNHQLGEHPYTDLIFKP